MSRGLGDVYKRQALDPCSHFGPHLHVSIIGTDSLSCELTFNHRTLHGQCSVNGKTLLDFGDKKHEGNATEMCADLSQSLRELSEGMRNQQSGKCDTECKGRQ